MKHNPISSRNAWRSLFLLGMLVLLAACGGSSTPTSSSTPVAGTTPTSGATPLVSPTSTSVQATPTATPHPPTPTPTHIVPTPTPSPTPKPTPSPTPPPTVTVTIMLNSSTDQYYFNPPLLTITPGTTVVWKNMTTAPHTATSDDGKTFNIGPIQPGQSFSFKFTQAGTFPYHCEIHPYMMAVIKVS